MKSISYATPLARSEELEDEKTDRLMAAREAISNILHLIKKRRKGRIGENPQDTPLQFCLTPLQ